MKRLALLLFLTASVASAADTVFVTVLDTPTAMPAAKALGRTSVLIENNGGDDLWCMYPAPGTDTAPAFSVGQGHKVPAGSWRPFPGNQIWCLAANSQSGCSGSATDCTAVSEAN